MMFVLQTLSLVCVSAFLVASQSLKLPTTATDFALRSMYVNGAAITAAYRGCRGIVDERVRKRRLGLAMPQRSRCSVGRCAERSS